MLRSVVEDVVEGDIEAECLADAIGELNLPEGISAAVKSYKRIENGKFVIIKDGKKYNSAGRQL